MNIIDKHGLLSLKHKIGLSSSGSRPFPIGKYQSLDDVLTSLHVDVIIEPGIITRTIPSALDKAEAFWRKEANRRECLIREADDREAAMKDYEDACENRKIITEEKEVWTTMPVRGLYDPKANVIRLYPEEMQKEYNGTCMDELLVTTLGHETMHAYFNRPRHKGFPYVIHVEEPLAEFGMLLWLLEIGSPLYDWAYQDVSSKRTCYRYGATLMHQHLSEGPASSVRQYLEAYKVKLINYPMPAVIRNGSTIILPGQGGRANSSVQVGGRTITSRWQDVFKCPPRYFYDPATRTLGLDGDWSDGLRNISSPHFDIDIKTRLDIELHDPINHVYLGDSFTIDYYYNIRGLLSEYDVIVSPLNRQLYAKNGVPFYTKDNTPVLNECGNGLYELCRNGKWGVVDAQLNQIVPFKYDCVWSFDENDLIRVRIDHAGGHAYGLVNKQGQEQVPVIYENVKKNPNGTYTVKQNGIEFVIDKNNNKI